MPFDRTKAALADILSNIEIAEEFVRGVSDEQFAADILRFHATTRVLEIISEASRRLPDALKARHPGVPWRQIADAGNVYRHGYDVVEPRVILETAQTGLVTLRRAVETELGK